MRDSMQPEEQKQERLPFSFITEAEGSILRCRIESPAPDQEYACYLLYQKDAERVIFCKDAYSTEKNRTYDLSALLPAETLPVLLSVKVFVRSRSRKEKRAVSGAPFEYPALTDPKISVILPVSRGGERLEETLRSLRTQDYRNVEYLLVDDASRDGSLASMRCFAAQERRARILRRKRPMAGAARNLGIQNATGEYLVFLEAGERLPAGLLREAIAGAKEAAADVADCSAGVRKDDKEDKNPDMPDEGVETNTWRVAAGIDGIQTFRSISRGIRNKLFRREFLLSRDIWFHPLEAADCGAFVWTALALAERIALWHAPLRIEGSGEQPLKPKRQSEDPLRSLRTLLEVKKRLRERGVSRKRELAFSCFALESAIRDMELLKEPGSFRAAYDAMKSFGVSELSLGDLSEDAAELQPGYYKKAQDILRCSVQEYAEANQLTDRLTHRLILSPSARPKSNPKVSVVIPVFNTERYLRKCLESVLGSSLGDIEILCLNDGSTDGSLQIMLEYQKQDNRIQIFDSPENRGLAAARNFAFDHARGAYVSCVDSDDWIEKDALEKLYAYAVKYDLSMLFFDAIPFYENSALEEAFSRLGAQYTSSVDLSFPRTGRRMFSDMLNSGSYRSNMCLQLLKRGELDRLGLRLYPGILYEDVLFTFECLLKSGRCARLGCPFYHRRYREGSIVTRRKGYADIRSYIICASEMLRTVEREGICGEDKEDCMIMIKRVTGAMIKLFKALPREKQKEFLDGYLSPLEVSWFHMIQSLTPDKV